MLIMFVLFILNLLNNISIVYPLKSRKFNLSFYNELISKWIIYLINNKR